MGWQVPAPSCVPVQTTPPSWPFAADIGATLTATARMQATRRAAMIVLSAVCFMVDAADVKVFVSPKARPGVIAVTAGLDLSTYLIGLNPLLTLSSLITHG